MVKLRRMFFFSLKIGIILYVCVLLIQLYLSDSLNTSTDGLKADADSKSWSNLKGYYYTTLQTSEINKPNSEINIKPTILTPHNSKLSMVLAPFILVVVCSHPSHVQRRLTIRRTWGYNLSKEAGVVFLVGEAKESSWISVIKRENVIHKDIIQVDILENYRNLTRKMISGFLLVLNKFPLTQYIIKTDDDVYINVPFMLEETRNKIGFLNHSQIMGALCTNSKVIRNPRDIWSVSSKIYPNITFPPYVAGGAYMLQASTLNKLISNVNKTPYLHLEDVYITGILAEAVGISRISHSGFSFWNSKSASACDFVKNRRISCVNMSGKQIKHLYQQIQTYSLIGCT